MFDAVLIANRGEIAVRIIRACRELGVRSVAVYSVVDSGAPHVGLADEAYPLAENGATASYLSIQRLLEVAQDADVDAIHPGYGFLAENAGFARAVADAGFVFVGPSPDVIAKMGDKLKAREVAIAADVPIVPGTEEPVTEAAIALAFAEEHGYPLAIKAMFGGGGRGMRIVESPDQLAHALEGARREATASFGRGECYVERYLERPRHVEVQVLADVDGTVVHLGERDCSLQRRHQKLVEEAPAPQLSSRVRESMDAAAIRIAREMNYTNAGTCEFLLDGDGETFYFLEMNTRLQVEHPTTELVTGIDLVHKQLQIASGDGIGLTQNDIRLSGHAIEVRINAEDPRQGFAPTPGLIEHLVAPQGPWVRFDGGATSGCEISDAYDSMIGKLIVWGETRDVARNRMARALDELELVGIPTTIPFHRFAMQHDQFAACQHSTRSVEIDWDLSCLPTSPSSSINRIGAHRQSPEALSVRDMTLNLDGQTLHVTVYGRDIAGGTDGGTRHLDRRHQRDQTESADHQPELRAPLQGVFVNYAVTEGDNVAQGDLICVIEAMKMENHVVAHRAGRIDGLALAGGDTIKKGSVVATIRADA